MRYGLIGAAGFVAPRHLEAIQRAGGTLELACDLSDSVGVLDRYWPQCHFTRYPDEFFSVLAGLDVAVICVPNFLHVPYAIEALKRDCHVVVEKPLGLDRYDLKALLAAANSTSRQIVPIAQLRYHPFIQTIRPRLGPNNTCVIDYSAFRGPWYDVSWKGDPNKSGGILANLGVHLVDLCLYLFGPIHSVELTTLEKRSGFGRFRCARAYVNWKLSSEETVPRRTFQINGVAVDLSAKMTKLHGEVYKDLEAGKQIVTLSEAVETIQALDRIRNAA